jgi:hypothetical protein
VDLINERKGLTILVHIKNVINQVILDYLKIRGPFIIRFQDLDEKSGPFFYALISKNRGKPIEDFSVLVSFALFAQHGVKKSINDWPYEFPVHPYQFSNAIDPVNPGTKAQVCEKDQ